MTNAGIEGRSSRTHYAYLPRRSGDGFSERRRSIFSRGSLHVTRSGLHRRRFDRQSFCCARGQLPNRRRRLGGKFLVGRRRRFGGCGRGNFRGLDRGGLFDDRSCGFLYDADAAFDGSVLLRKILVTNFVGENGRDRVGRHINIHTFTPHFFNQALGVDLKFFGEIVKTNFVDCCHALLAASNRWFGISATFRSALQGAAAKARAGRPLCAKIRSGCECWAASLEASHCFSSFELSIAATSFDSISELVCASPGEATVAASVSAAVSSSFSAASRSPAGVISSGRRSRPASFRSNSSSLIGSASLSATGSVADASPFSTASS